MSDGNSNPQQIESGNSFWIIIINMLWHFYIPHSTMNNVEKCIELFPFFRELYIYIFHLVGKRLTMQNVHFIQDCWRGIVGCPHCSWKYRERKRKKLIFPSGSQMTSYDKQIKIIYYSTPPHSDAKQHEKKKKSFAWWMKTYNFLFNLTNSEAFNIKSAMATIRFMSLCHIHQHSFDYSSGWMNYIYVNAEIYKIILSS